MTQNSEDTADKVEIVGLEVLENKNKNISKTVSSTSIDSDDIESHGHDSVMLNRRRLQVSPEIDDDYVKDSLHLARTKVNTDDSKDILPIEFESSFAESWFSNSTCDVKRLPPSRNVSADLTSMRPTTISNHAA